MSSSTPAKGSPPVSRPSSPSPSRSGFRTLARVGTLLTGRRNSSGLSIRSLTRSASKSSLNAESASQTPAAEVHAPSPVAESPAREAAANAAEAIDALHRPSPLSNEAKATPEPSPAPPPPMIRTTEPEPVQDAVLTAEPESVSEPILVAEPLPMHDEPAKAPPAAPEARSTQEEATASTTKQRAPSVPAAPTATTSTSVATTPQPSTAPATEEPILPAHPRVPIEERGPDYFSWDNMPITATKKPSTSTISVQERVVVEPSVVAQPTSAPPASVPATAAPVIAVPPVVVAPSIAPPVTNIPPSTVALAAAAPVTVAAEIAAPSVPSVATIPAASAPAPSENGAPVSTSNGTPATPAEFHHDPYAAAAADSFAWKDEGLVLGSKQPSTEIPHIPSNEQLVSPKQSVSSLKGSVSRQPVMASPQSLSRSLSPKGSRSSIASSYGNVVNVSTGSRRVSVSIDQTPEQIRGRSRSRGSVRVSFDDPYTDPFADPPVSTQMVIPHTALSPIVSIDTPMIDAPAMPQAIAYPEPELYPVAQEQQSVQPASYVTTQDTATISTADETPAPMSMPLPALNEVANVPEASRILRPPSAYSMAQSSSIADFAPHETNERLPLLPRPPNAFASQAPAPYPLDDAPVVPPANGVPWPPIQRLYAAQGWTQYILPDNSIYYSHSSMKVTTDIDLRNTRKLETVMQYLNGKDSNGPILPPPGWELFLRDAGKLQYDFTPIKSFVNHNERILTFDSPQSIDIHALSEDDKLDSEYRYWTYIELHPAHTVISQRAEAEAMDALKWSYTDAVLPSNRGSPPLFPPQECQNLMGLLKGPSGNDAPTSSVTHARIVARVLLRKAEWRQECYRPDKPLPGKTARQAHPPRSFRRTFVDVVMAILCLGIPYLFIGRSSSRRVDEEGAMRSQGPMLVIGACACLVAAVILSASVTLLTLPGLDDISRLAGMIAILFSASSMVSAVVALFKYKADLERTVVYVGGEGLMVLSRRSIVMSLPVVFLAWAIAAFVTGITFYSFRGVTLTSKVIIREQFTDYTHWAVVGGLGGLAGMFLVFALLGGR